MQNKNLKLKLGLCGLALTSFLAVNAHSVVHADTVSDSNSNNNAITWGSDSDDSQAVKEQPQQQVAPQTIQKQSTVQASQSQPVQNKKIMVSDVSSVSVSQKHAETSIVRQSNAQTSTVNRLNANVACNSRENTNLKVANVYAVSSGSGSKVTYATDPVNNQMNDADDSTTVVNPQNNIIRVNFVKTNGQNTNVGSYDIDVSTDNGNSYKLPDGYALANSNEHYNIERSNHKFYVYNGVHTYNGIDPHLSNITFESTLNPNLQNELQMTVDLGDAPLADRDGSKGILYLYNEVPLKANFSIYGVPRNIEATASQDIANSTAIANKMGLSYDQLKALVFNAVYDPSTNATRWMRMNAILDKTTTSVDHKYSFSDPNVKSIVGNVVNVAVIQPTIVRDANQTRKSAERIISVNLPDDPAVRDRYKGILNSNNQIVQTLTFTRNLIKDGLTGTTLSDSGWQGPSSFPAVTLPDIPGYTMTMS